MHILVTGGTGFIGSHTCVSLIEAGHDVTIIDDLSNSSREALDCVEKIAGKRPSFFEGDVRDRELLRKIFAQRPVDPADQAAHHGRKLFALINREVGEPDQRFFLRAQQRGA